MISKKEMELLFLMNKYLLSNQEMYDGQWSGGFKKGKGKYIKNDHIYEGHFDKNNYSVIQEEELNNSDVLANYYE